MSDMEENRSLTGSPPLPEHLDTATDSSSESRVTPEPSNDDEKTQRQLLEISLAKCLGQFGAASQRTIPIYPHKVIFLP
uniref:Uncharacterized protein n=1 Tax=Panagrolaimus sp. ES5 TaxID=591445 RepID=A0AC34FZQ4_9BILA